MGTSVSPYPRAVRYRDPRHVPPRAHQPPRRGLLSFTSQLNLSTLYVIGGARRGHVARVKGVLGGV